MFVVTGTPFVTKISYDFIAMTRAVAKEEVRASWSGKATDAGLHQLVSGWVSVTDGRYLKDDKVKEHEDTRREQIAELLPIYMIRRTERSKIRGVPVMEDHFAWETYKRTFSLQSVGFSWRKAAWSRVHGDCKSSSAGTPGTTNTSSSAAPWKMRFCFSGKYRGWSYVSTVSRGRRSGPLRKKWTPEEVA